MKVSKQVVGNVLVLRPDGRVDNQGASVLQEALAAGLAGPGQAVLLDMGDIDHIGSAGLAALLMAVKEAKRLKKQFAVADLTPVVKDIFVVTRFALLVQVFQTTSFALNKMS